MEPDAPPALVAGLVMAVGLAGTIVPAVPGTPLIWIAALGYGVAVGFGALGIVAMVAITALFAAGVAAKIVLPQRAASAGGAPRSTLVVAGVGGIIGFFVVPIVGFALGAIAGILLAEYRRTGDWAPAWRSTKGVIVGFGIGTLLEIAAAVAMIATWAVWVAIRA